MEAVNGHRRPPEERRRKQLFLPEESRRRDGEEARVGGNLPPRPVILNDYKVEAVLAASVEAPGPSMQRFRSAPSTLEKNIPGLEQCTDGLSLLAAVASQRLSNVMRNQQHNMKPTARNFFNPPGEKPRTSVVRKTPLSTPIRAEGTPVKSASLPDSPPRSTHSPLLPPSKTESLIRPPLPATPSRMTRPSILSRSPKPCRSPAPLCLLRGDAATPPRPESPAVVALFPSKFSPARSALDSLIPLPPLPPTTPAKNDSMHRFMCNETLDDLEDTPKGKEEKTVEEKVQTILEDVPLQKEEKKEEEKSLEVTTPELIRAAAALASALTRADREDSEERKRNRKRKNNLSPDESRPVQKTNAATPVKEESKRKGKKKEPLYCSCQRVSFGGMICCDSDECPIEWFHFGCVGLKSKPKGGKWYCPQCRKDPKTPSLPK